MDRAASAPRAPTSPWPWRPGVAQSTRATRPRRPRPRRPRPRRPRPRRPRPRRPRPRRPRPRRPRPPRRRPRRRRPRRQPRWSRRHGEVGALGAQPARSTGAALDCAPRGRHGHGELGALGACATPTGHGHSEVGAGAVGAARGRHGAASALVDCAKLGHRQRPVGAWASPARGALGGAGAADRRVQAGATGRAGPGCLLQGVQA